MRGFLLNGIHMNKVRLSTVLVALLAACSDVSLAPAPGALAVPEPRASLGIQPELIPNQYIVRFRDDEPSSISH